MGKLFDWLFGKAEEIEETAEKLVEKVDIAVETKKEEKAEKFVDSETGKSYKTAGALKGAITRRKNKMKKSKAKKSKKTTKKTKK